MRRPIFLTIGLFASLAFASPAPAQSAKQEKTAAPAPKREISGVWS